MKIKQFLKEEIKGWKKVELAWLLIASITIMGLSIYWHDRLMGIVSAITGVLCVICTGKGKLSAYLFGFINCALYAIIAYEAHLYGEVMLNALYYIPMQFVGFYIWSTNMNNNSHEVKKKHMKNKERCCWFLVMVLGTVLYVFLLKAMKDAMPFVDSFTTVSSIVAMIVSVKMYAEQWWIWILVDIFSVYMWWCNFSVGNDNIATLLMWMVYLLNAIFMCIKWEKEAHKRGSYEI